jgi:hypothetical protein
MSKEWKDEFAADGVEKVRAKVEHQYDDPEKQAYAERWLAKQDGAAAKKAARMGGHSRHRASKRERAARSGRAAWLAVFLIAIVALVVFAFYRF